MAIENKKLVLAGVVAAMLLTGCGKNTPATPAAPVLLDDGAGPTAAAPAAMEELPADALPPATTPADETPPADASDASDDATAEAEAAAKKKAEEEAAAKKKAEDEAAAKKKADEEAAAKKKAEEEAAAKKKADEEAAAKAKAEAEAAAKKAAEEEARLKAEKLAKQTPKFKVTIGDGSLHSANGLAVSGNSVFVVDNNRTGLLGKFAAVREYDIATGDFKTSFENIGWGGAKNLPTSVTHVKLEDGNILAADGVKTWTFSGDGALVSTADTTFVDPQEVTDAKTGDVFRIHGGKIDRVHGGDVLLSFGGDELDTPLALAIDGDGNLYVSEKSKGVVIVFSAPEL